MFYGWFVVGGSFTTLFIAFGAAYSFTAFFDQLQGEFSASRASVSLIFSIGASLYFGLGAVSGAIADRINARWVIAAGDIHRPGSLKDQLAAGPDDQEHWMVRVTSK